MQMPIYTFDAYGTLFDVHSAITRHRIAAGPDAERMSEIWRNKQLEYSWTLTLSGQYLDFWTLTERALDYALARTSVDRALKPKLLNAYLELGAFADAKPTLAELKMRGHSTAILSNGSPRMLRGAVNAAGVGENLDTLISIDTLRMFKPRQEVYGLVTRHFSCKPAQVVFVSSNRWDVMGASKFGFRCVWINRTKLPDEYPEQAPSRTVGSLTDLLGLDLG